MSVIPLKNLVVYRSSLFKAFDDCERGKCSYTNGPVEVMALDKEPGKYQLVDGYHRLIEYLLSRQHIKRNHKIPVYLSNDEGVKNYYSITPREERWDYNKTLKYGNLEDLADQDILDELVLRLYTNKEKVDGSAKKTIFTESYSKKRWQLLAGIITENKDENSYEEVQSDLFRGSGVNASTDFENKIPKYAAYMKSHGWGAMPPIHGVIQTIDKEDVKDYQEAEEAGYEHELDWSRPLSADDIGTTYVSIEDGHNRAWAAKKAGIPIRVKVFK